MKKLIDHFTLTLGSQNVLTGEDIGTRYTKDSSVNKPQTPIAVLRPSSTEQISEILSYCNQHKQKVVVQGGMTGVVGGSTPQAGEIAISLERLSAVEEIDKASMTMTVQAGTPLQKVQEAAKEDDVNFPLDLGSRGSCTIGGNIATNAGGNQVIRYGMTRALVLGLEVVLADGTVLSSMNKMLKNNAGMDLKQLFIGSEGILGIITRAVLRVFPQPLSKCSAMCAVDNFDAVIEFLHRASSELGGSVNSFEVMWDNYYHTVLREIDQLTSPFEENFPFYVLLETTGSNQQLDDQKFEQFLGAALEDKLIQDAAIAQSQQQAESFWNIRDGVGLLLNRLPPLANFDVSVPISKMKAFIDSVNNQLKHEFENIDIMIFGHLGDSNLHIIARTGKEEDVKTIRNIVYQITGEFHGSISAEHGIGTEKKNYLSSSRTTEEIEIMKKLKQTLDPENILNSGRVI